MYNDAVYKAAFVDGFQTAMRRIESLYDSAQQRVNALLEQANTLRDIRALIENRLRELTDAMRNNRPSDPTPWLPDVPALPFVIDAAFFDISKPFSQSTVN